MYSKCSASTNQFVLLGFWHFDSHHVGINIEADDRLVTNLATLTSTCGIAITWQYCYGVVRGYKSKLMLEMEVLQSFSSSWGRPISDIFPYLEGVIVLVIVVLCNWKRMFYTAYGELQTENKQWAAVYCLSIWQFCTQMAIINLLGWTAELGKHHVPENLIHTSHSLCIRKT